MDKKFKIQYVARTWSFVPIFKRKILTHFKISNFILNLRQSVIVFILTATLFAKYNICTNNKYYHIIHTKYRILISVIPRSLNALKSMYNTLSQKKANVQRLFWIL